MYYIFEFSKWTTISCYVKNIHSIFYPVTPTLTQFQNFLSHLCDLAHDLGRRLEAELVTSSVYEGV